MNTGYQPRHDSREPNLPPRNPNDGDDHMPPEVRKVVRAALTALFAHAWISHGEMLNSVGEIDTASVDRNTDACEALAERILQRAGL